MLITVAIPCYKSSKTICCVVDEIRQEFKTHPEYSYQIVLVNDGSPDETFRVIREMCAADQSVVGIDLSRNYTQANAKMAALPYVKGDILVYMDDDGQHPASGIFMLAEKIQEGYDLVYAKFTRKKVSGFKAVTSEWNSKIREFLGVKPKGIRTSPFMALNRLAIDKAKEYHSPSPSLGAYLLKVTTRIANVELEQRARITGKSGYTLKKLVDLAVQGYTNFTIVPLRLASYTGLLTSAIGLLYGLFLLIRKIIHPSVPAGYTSIMAVLLIIGGMLMVMLGIIGEYVGKTYMLLSNTPQYTVREEINVSGNTENQDK